MSSVANPAVSAPHPRNELWRARRKVWLALILIILTVVTSLVLWNNVLKQRFVVRNWGVVEPNSIYRSGQISRYLVSNTLEKNGIDVVIFLSIDKPNRPDVEAEVAACKKLNIERHNFPLDGDGTGDIHQYAAALVLLAKSVDQRKRVLVHCHAGAQRTSGLIFAYRTLVQHKTAETAYAEMVSFGHDPEDNPHLIPYLNAHMHDLAAALVDAGVIDAIPSTLPVAMK